MHPAWGFAANRSVDRAVLTVSHGHAPRGPGHAIAAGMAAVPRLVAGPGGRGARTAGLCSLGGPVIGADDQIRGP